MAPALQNPASNITGADSLQDAFQMFLHASQSLEGHQQHLHREIEHLSANLAATNAKLRVQIAEKQDATNRLRALLQALPAGVLLVEAGLVVEYNPAASALIGGLTIGQPWRLPEQWARTSVPDEYLAGSVDDGDKVVQVRIVASGPRSMIQLLDVTSTVQTHARNEREAKLVAMGRMAADIAHQLRTPLSTALLYASHLADGNLAEDDRAQFAQRLRDQLVRLEGLASSMLGFVRERPKQVEVISLAELAEDAIASCGPLFEKRGVALVRSIEAGENVITINRQQIRSAIVALLENALEVSTAGQTIAFDVRVEGQRAHIVVQDQGPGIASSMMDHLFEPFSTTRVTGTGLGLSIARTAVEAHRGQIDAVNCAEGGARFTVILPCMAEL